MGAAWGVDAIGAGGGVHGWMVLGLMAVDGQTHGWGRMWMDGGTDGGTDVDGWVEAYLDGWPHRRVSRTSIDSGWCVSERKVLYYTWKSILLVNPPMGLDSRVLYLFSKETAGF